MGIYMLNYSNIYTIYKIDLDGGKPSKSCPYGGRSWPLQSQRGFNPLSLRIGGQIASAQWFEGQTKVIAIFAEIWLIIGLDDQNRLRPGSDESCHEELLPRRVFSPLSRRMGKINGKVWKPEGQMKVAENGQGHLKDIFKVFVVDIFLKLNNSSLSGRIRLKLVVEVQKVVLLRVTE